jgi:transcriptional regulator with XRE-family HTH domain
MGGIQKLVTVVQSGLAWDLKDIRNQRGLTLEDVCDKLRWQQSKLSRMEQGQQCISQVDLGALLAIYEVHGKERQRLLHLTERQDDPGRWETYLPEAPGPRTFFRLEPEATALVATQLLFVPGLAQTADYTRAVMKAGYVPPEQVEARVAERMERRKILTRSKPPKLTMIVAEIALRRVFGSPKIMAVQLRTMLDLAELPNVRLWVVPSARTADAAFNDSFYLMDFPHDKSVVVLDSATSTVFLEESDKIDFYRRHASRLVKAALNPDESANFLATLTKEYQRE